MVVIGEILTLMAFISFVPKMLVLDIVYWTLFLLLFAVFFYFEKNDHIKKANLTRLICFLVIISINIKEIHGLAEIGMISRDLLNGYPLIFKDLDDISLKVIVGSVYFGIGLVVQKIPILPKCIEAQLSKKTLLIVTMVIILIAIR